MKRVLAFIACVLAIISNFCTQAQPANATGNSLLWKITGKDLTRPSYLFGTMHMICRDDYVWTDAMKKSLAQSEKICFEMDLDNQEVMMKIASGLIDNSGKKLKDYFTPHQYELMKRYLKDSAGMDIALFEQMKPVALQSIMATGAAACSDQVSYEDKIMTEGVKTKKEILGLETPEEQLAVLESIPADTVIKELVDMLEHGNTQKDNNEYAQLISAYKKQDIGALYLQIAQSKELGDGMGVFLDDRNRKWIGRMSDKMKLASIFFAVGAGHLGGSNGVIALLQKNGYKVEAVN